MSTNSDATPIRLWLRSGAAACALALALAGLPAAAGAAPLFFSPTAGFGFDGDGLDPFGVATPEEQIAAANLLFGGDLDLDLELEQSIAAVISRPELPTLADPYIADVELVVRNTSGEVLPDAVLAFTAVAPYAGSGLQLAPELVGLDSDSIGILRYVAGATELFLGAVPLGSLDPDETLVHTVRYVVATDMPLNETGGFILPPLGVTGFRTFQPVPEPAAVALVGLALLALGARRSGWWA